MITLSKEQVKSLHTKLIGATGGMDDIRDEGMLDSALSAAFQTFDGIELYPSVAGKIARIVYCLICNHPFIDGNKRIGVYVMMVLLELNNIEAGFSDEEITRIGLDLANGRMDDRQLLDFIIAHTK